MIDSRCLELVEAVVRSSHRTGPTRAGPPVPGAGVGCVFEIWARRCQRTGAGPSASPAAAGPGVGAGDQQFGQDRDHLLVSRPVAVPQQPAGGGHRMDRPLLNPSPPTTGESPNTAEQRQRQPVPGARRPHHHGRGGEVGGDTAPLQVGPKPAHRQRGRRLLRRLEPLGAPVCPRADPPVEARPSHLRVDHPHGPAHHHDVVDIGPGARDRQVMQHGRPTPARDSGIEDGERCAPHRPGRPWRRRR